MTEIRSVNVPNEEEIACIEFHHNFGWKHKSSQRIYSKDTHLERWDLSVVSVTETTDFTKIVFERDKDTKNYQQLADFEEAYISICNRIPDTPPRYYDNCSTMEQWAAKAKPSVAKAKLAPMIALLTVILTGALIGYDTWINHAKITLNTTMMLLFSCFILSVIISLIYDGVRNRSALREAISNPASKYRDELNRQYQNYLQDISDYNALIAQRDEIAFLAEVLVRNDQKADRYISN